MPKISELTQGTDVDTAAKEAVVLVPVVQNGATRHLTLAQALAARLPVGTPLDGMADMPASGDGYPYRNALGLWSIDPLPGSGSWDPAGAATAEVSDHNANAGAHGGVEAAFGSHDGVGGVTKHPVATTLLAGFMPALSGDATQVLNGAGAWVVQRALVATSALNFTAPGAVPGQTDLTVTVTGAVVGDPVTFGPEGTIPVGYQITAWVSAANTVTVRLHQYAGAAAGQNMGTCHVSVWKH